jgi:hypothetical protein
MISGLSLYKHNTVYIEDALGWKFPIILDAHPSWEVSNFYALLFTRDVLTDTDCSLNNPGPICTTWLSRPGTGEIKKIHPSGQ